MTIKRFSTLVTSTLSALLLLLSLNAQADIASDLDEGLTLRQVIGNAKADGTSANYIMVTLLDLEQNLDAVVIDLANNTYSQTQILDALISINVAITPAVNAYVENAIAAYNGGVYGANGFPAPAAGTEPVTTTPSTIARPGGSGGGSGGGPNPNSPS